MHRRDFLAAAAAAVPASLAATELPRTTPPKRTAKPSKKLAVVTTVYYYLSHAYHICGRFLNGYLRGKEYHFPDAEIASVHVEQVRANDLSRDLAKRHGFRLSDSVADALTLGTGKLAVDGVLLIAEHGDYPYNAKGQKLYPRYELFSKVVDVFKDSKKAVPVFNDKHLSYDRKKGFEMARTATAPSPKPASRSGGPARRTSPGRHRCRAAGAEEAPGDAGPGRVLHSAGGLGLSPGRLRHPGVIVHLIPSIGEGGEPMCVRMLVPLGLLGLLAGCGEDHSKPVRVIPPPEVKPAVQGKLEIPKSFPTDMPLYPGAKLTKADTDQGETILLFETEDSAEKVTEFFVKELAKKGWAIKEHHPPGSATVRAASKGDATVAVQVERPAEKTLITLSHREK